MLVRKVRTSYLSPTIDCNEEFAARVCSRVSAFEADLDDDAARVIAETRQYLDDVGDLLPKNSTATAFFNGMLRRYPNRRPGATTLWAGTRSLYASRDRQGDEVQKSLAARL